MTNSPLVVMYHYVWPDQKPPPAGIRPLLASEFQQQLDWLESRYRIVPPDAFLNLLQQGNGNERPPCLLTFDDGTRDHAEVVTPILHRRGLAGLFFVLTWPTELKRMPLTHGVHWLLSQGEEQVWRQFEDAAVEEFGNIHALGDPAEAQRIYYYETPLRARIKYAANMSLPPDLVGRVLQRVLLAAGQSQEDLATQWFASSQQLLAMRDAGMTIALHGCSHRSLQTLGPDGIRQEIAHSSRHIASLLGHQPTWFACPFGGSGASPQAVEAMYAAMREAGIRASVTTQKSLVPRGCDPWNLPRLDTIDLPPRNPFPQRDGSGA